MIDKSIRQHYDVPETKKIKGQLHKLAYITPKEAKLLQKSGGQKVMTPEGVPAYPPQGRSAQHGGKSSSTSGGKTSTGSGNTGASHDRGGQQHQKAAAPKAAAPKDEPDRRSIALANQYVAPTLTVEPKKSEDDVKQSVIDIGFQEALKKEKIAEDLKKELDKDFLFQDAKAKAPTTLEPKTVTYDRGNPFTKRLIPTTVGQTLFDPRTSQNALLDRGSGTGFLKGLGTLAASVFLPMLLPARAAATYKMYNTAKTISSAAKKFGLTKDDKLLSLRSKFLNSDMQKQLLKDEKIKVANLTNKKKRTTTDDRGDGVNRILPESLQSTVSEGTQQFLSDEQKEQYIVQQNKMKAALAEGYYVDTKRKTNSIR